MPDNNPNMLVCHFVYCKHCYYGKLPENYDPCNECLAVSGRENSRRPINYKKWDKKSKRPTAPQIEKPRIKHVDKITIEDW